MPGRNLKSSVMGVLLSLIFVFTTIFGAGNLTTAMADEQSAAGVEETAEESKDGTSVEADSSVKQSSEESADSNTEKTSESQKENEVIVFIQAAKGTKELYLLTYNECKALSLAKDDINDYETASGANWGREHVALKEVKEGTGLFRVDFIVNSDDTNGGFGIYSDYTGNDNSRIFNAWGSDYFSQIIAAKGKTIVIDISGKDYKISDDLSSYGITDELIKSSGAKTDSTDNTGKTDAEDTETAVTDSIRGADLSAYISIQEAFDQMNSDKYLGRTDWEYKDFDGNIIRNQEFFNFLAKQGMNWVRIRVWNDPYDSNGNGYGGGTNDLKKAITMGQWATKAGMKVLIDFHYSDGWADPSRQTAPKAWKSFDGDPDKTAEAVSEFTKESLQKLLDAGVDVEMVQVGNETNNGIAGVSPKDDWTENVDKVYAAGCDAVHEVAKTYGKTILAAVHFTDPQDSGKQLGYAANLNKGKVNYDVFATSAYPFWHGTAASIKENLQEIAQKYHKQVMVAETSYPYTLSEIDGFENTVNEKKNSSDDVLQYPVTVNGQAQQFRTMADAVSSITFSDGKKAGWGAFYWEGAWNGLVDVNGMSDKEKSDALKYEESLWDKYGCGWASKYAAEYDKQAPTEESGGAVIENQSFFGGDGKALKSLRAFAEDYDPSTEKIEENLTVKSISTETSEIVLDADETLTTDLLGNAKVNYTNGSAEKINVVWNTDDIALVNSNDSFGKTFTVKGTADGVTVTRKVKRLNKNILTNGNFETGDTTGWTVTEGSEGGVVKSSVGSDTYKGSYSLHFWGGDHFSYEISQKVKVTEPGIYTLSMVTQGSLAGDADEVYLKYELNGEEKTVTDTFGGWREWGTPSLTVTVTRAMIDSGKNEITVYAGIKATAGSWGDFDEIKLVKTEDVSEDTKPSSGESGKPSTGNNDSQQTAGGTSQPSGGNNDSQSSGGNNSSQPVTGNNDSQQASDNTDKQTTGDSDGNSSDTTDKQTESVPAVSATKTDNGVFVTDDGKAAVKTIVKDQDGKLFATDKKGKAVTNKSVTIDGRKYVATKDGTLADEGLAKIGKKTFVVKEDHTVAKSETVNIDGKTYLAKSNGLLARKEIVKASNGKKYYADSKGRVVTSKLVSVKGKKYLTDSKGAIITNKWVTYKNKKYFCSKSGKITKTK
jgi:arabinogalactan endo-1,4-beta-galactosidase